MAINTDKHVFKGHLLTRSRVARLKASAAAEEAALFMADTLKVAGKEVQSAVAVIVHATLLTESQPQCVSA